MKVTVAQIARAAKVSPGTVSNALNNRKGSLSEETRAHILRVAEELGYFKRGKRTGIIRLIMYFRNANIIGDTPFFSELIRGIELECSAQGFQLIVNHIDSDQLYGEAGQRLLADVSGCDGIIFLGTEMSKEDIKELGCIKLPFVIVDTAFNIQGYDYIVINNVDGVYEMIHHLMDFGHERIGLINSAYQINNFRERKIGFLQALADRGFGFQKEWEALVEPTIEGSYLDMLAYLKRCLAMGMQLPSAFFAVNDNMALGASKAFNELGLHVSIAGFDDIPACSIAHPALTTVQVDKLFLGKSAVQRLLAKMKDPQQQVQKILVGTKLVYRDSVQRIAAKAGEMEDKI